MKKNIIIGAVLFIISLSNSIAQNGATAVTASVAQSFEKSFKGAQHAQWTSCGKKISLAQFRYQEKAWLAYFDRHGELISSGRKLTIHELPVRVQNGLFEMKGKLEKKYGAMTVGGIYEMLTAGVTEYYTPLGNSKIKLMIAVRTDGTSVVKSKKPNSEAPTLPKEVIARKD